MFLDVVDMRTVSNFVQEELMPFTASVRSFLPKYVVQPLNHSKDSDITCIIRQGDSVSEGQTVGECARKSGLLLHSSIPGTVDSLVTCPLPDGHVGKAVRIRLSGSFSFLGKPLRENSWKDKTPGQLKSVFLEKGVINTFGEPVSLSKSLERRRSGDGGFLVVRMFDEDPSRSTDSFVARAMTKEVVQGAYIIAKSMSADGVIFVCPAKESLDIDTAAKNFLDLPYVCISANNSRYPAGYKQNLINTIRENSRNLSNQMFAKVNHNSVFVDPGTSVAAYEAVVFGKPCLEQFVHVTGNCLRSAALFRVRLGTPIENLVTQCGGFKKRPGKIIVNGIICGTAISDLATPVTKYVKSVSFVPAAEFMDSRISACIRCVRCRTICPEGLYPDLMFLHRTGGKSPGPELLATADLCSFCALCNSVCPARLPLSQTISLLRSASDE